MTEIRFNKNRKSKIRGLILSIFTSLLAIVMIFLGIQSQSNSIVIIFTGFLALGIYLITKSIQTSDTVIVNKVGISSKVNGMGLITWEFIESFEIKKAVNTTVLVINVNDSEKLLSTINKASQKLMKSNIKRLGSPVVIPQSEFHEPLEVSLSKIEKYKNNL